MAGDEAVSACTVTAAAKTSPIAAESNFATGPFFQHPKSNTADDDNLNITYNNNIPDTVDSPLHPTPSRRCFFVSVSQTRDPLPANVPTCQLSHVPRPAIATTIRLAFSRVPKYLPTQIQIPTFFLCIPDNATSL